VPWRSALLAALAGLGAYGTSVALARVPALAERGYAQGVGPWLTRPLSLATGVFPFSVFEVLAGAYLLWLGLAATRALRALSARRRTALEVAGAGALRVVRDGGLLVFLLYALWGFNYARPPLETRLGWSDWEPGELAEVVALSEAAVDLTNRSYLVIHGSGDAGAPTAMPEDLGALESALDEGWARAAGRLGLPASVASRYGRVKQPLISPVLARIGLFGVYVPFTAEANVIRGLPAVRKPFSMAHEKAHQRGVAIEAEASFLGYLASVLSDDPHARYAAASFAQSQLVSALPAGERRRVARLRLPGVERDLQDLEAYQRRNRTAATGVQSAMNDRYLRANRVPGGILSYGLSARLLIQYAREHPQGAGREAHRPPAGPTPEGPP
jgi:hypothetical protein